MIPDTTDTTIEYLRPSVCPRCGSKFIYGHGHGNTTLIDLRFMRHGIKRWIVRQAVHRYRCLSCGSTFYPPARFGRQKKYGHNVIAYVLYQNIELGIPQNRIARSMKLLFGLNFSRDQINQFKAAAAQIYECVYSKILKKLCSGRLLHADETSVSVMGKGGYVWVLTSMEDVAYFYTPTREGNTIQAMLKDFSGVLVSDFYAAYDAIQCSQQKCLIHFIRDLNDELLKHPYDNSSNGSLVILRSWSNQ